MSTIAEMVVQLGGIAQKQELVRLGATSYRLTAAVRAGQVFRARQGWYSTVDPFVPRLRATRVGGRLTGLSALNDYGAWSQPSSSLHVSVPRTASRLRTQDDRHRIRSAQTRDGVVLHYDHAKIVRTGGRHRVSLIDALEACLLSEPFEVSVPPVDWALRQKWFDLVDFEELLLRLPPRLRKIRRLVDQKSGSYLESLARVRLLQAGFALETQVEVEQKWWIDIVVDGWLAIEVDGKEFHSERFEEDRSRDLELTLRGYHVVRLSYGLIVDHWEVVLAAIRSARASRYSLIPQNSG